MGNEAEKIGNHFKFERIVYTFLDFTSVTRGGLWKGGGEEKAKVCGMDIARGG